MNAIINHVLDERKIKQVILCMHSFGNVLGLSYARHNKERVGGVIGICGVLDHIQRGHFLIH